MNKKCEHGNFEMQFSKLLSIEYEGEAEALFKAICQDCGKHVKAYDEKKIYRGL